MVSEGDELFPAALCAASVSDCGPFPLNAIVGDHV
jgi:hypothetical protein